MEILLLYCIANFLLVYSVLHEYFVNLNGTFLHIAKQIALPLFLIFIYSLLSLPCLVILFNKVCHIEAYHPYLAVRTGPTGYRYADHLVPL